MNKKKKIVVERPLVSASLQKVAESNVHFTTSNLNMTNQGDIYKSQKVKFAEINGYWNMTVTVCEKGYDDKIYVELTINSKMPNQLDYDRFTVKADIAVTGHSTKFPDAFLKEKLIFTSYPINISKVIPSISYDVSLSLSSLSNSHDCVPTSAVYKQIIDNNISIMNDPTYSDFTFVVEGNEFKVHKNILAATSPVFVKIFNTKMQESIENKCIVHFSSNIFNQMLRFIYGGLLPGAIADDAFDLYEAAHYYDIKNLMAICEKSIRLNLSVSNACSVFQFAELYDMEDLKRDALKQFNIDINNYSPEKLAEMFTKIVKERESELQRKGNELLIDEMPSINDI